MALNHVTLNGRIPGFDPAVYNEGEDGKSSFLVWSVNVKREYKKDDEQYYPDDLIRIKAWGPKADFIMNYFEKGDGIIIEGRLQKDDDYEDDEGNERKGELFVLVESVHFLDGAGKSSSDKSGSKSSGKSGKSGKSSKGSKSGKGSLPKPGSKSSGLPKPPKKSGNMPF